MGVGAGGAEDVVGYVGDALEVLEDVAGFCRGEVGRGVARRGGLWGTRG